MKTSAKEQAMIDARNRRHAQKQKRPQSVAIARRTIPQLRNKRLARLEEITAKIQRWNREGFEVAEHLREVRDDELYLEKYSSLEEYGLEEFGWQHSQTYAMASWADVRLGLPVAIAATIETESQARALSAVKEPDRPGVVKRVLRSGEPVTAKAITEAAKPRELKPKKKKKVPIVIDIEPEPKPAIKNSITLDIAECLVCETETLCLIEGKIRYCEPCISEAFEKRK